MTRVRELLEEALNGYAPAGVVQDITPVSEYMKHATGDERREVVGTTGRAIGIVFLRYGRRSYFGRFDRARGQWDVYNR